jgi:hypothetical protein
MSAPNPPEPALIAELVRLTLTFDTPLEDVRRYLGDDFKPEGEGLTVEALASSLVRNHHAKYGYIAWRVGADS